MPTPAETFAKLYDAYMPEMIQHTITTYEHYRNLDVPDNQAAYQVNRKRYKDEFWRRVVAAHIRHHFNPEHTIPFARQLAGGKMPWPDLIRRLPEMLSGDHSLTQKLNSITADSFRLGCFKGCNTPQKQETAIERWKQRNPATSGPQYEATFCHELISRNLTYLLNNPEGRWLTATVLLRAMEQGGLEQLYPVTGSQLEELASQTA